MSEKNLPEPVEPAESGQELKFSQEHYDRLMKGQGPWLKFRREWPEGGGTWSAFKDRQPQDFAAIGEAIAEWNAAPPAGAYLEGANLINAHLDKADLRRAHLERARLRGAHLEGAKLRLAQLQESDLRDAQMHGADLGKAQLERAILRRARLDRANLHAARMGGADLREATLAGAAVQRCDLKGADLSNANLMDATGLTAGQLAGADVTSARLPPDIKNFESLKVADEAAKNSRSLFLVMLLACVYSWLTLATTTDQALIMRAGSSLLPIIRVPVPIEGFFLAAPIFLLAAYAYFHLYLHGLWSRLAELPAVFPDGRPLDQRAYPWLLTSLVRLHFERLRADRPLFSKAKVRLSIVLAWWVVPVTIYLFWAQALAAHVWYMTALHLALFITSLGVGVITYRGAIATLRLEDPPATTPRDVVRQVAAAGSGRIPIATVLMLLLSWFALWGPRRLPSVPLLFGPYADLTVAQLSTRTREFEGDSVEVDFAVLEGRNLRFASMFQANLEEAFLGGADLSGADLVVAVLNGAHLNGANLGGAFLRGANLGQADLRGADLTMAVLNGAHLNGANLNGANLSGAFLGGADLSGAFLTGVGGGSAPFWLRAASSGAVCRDPETGELTTFEAPTDGGAPEICRRP